MNRLERDFTVGMFGQAENDARGFAQSDDRAPRRPVAPPETPRLAFHRDAFAFVWPPPVVVLHGWIVPRIDPTDLARFEDDGGPAQ